MCGGHNSLNLYAKNGFGFGIEFNNYVCQWFRNDTLVTGQTSATITANKSGIYRVLMRRGICQDTSAPILVKLANCSTVEKNTTLYPSKKTIIFPNAHQKECRIRLPENISINSLRLFGVTGDENQIDKFKYEDGAIRLSTNGLPKGLYLLEIRGKDWQQTVKLMKDQVFIIWKSCFTHAT